MGGRLLQVGAQYHKMKNKIEKAKDYVKSSFRELKGSFKSLDRTILFVTLYNLVFFFASITIGLRYSSLFTERMNRLFGGVDFNAVRMGPSPELAGLAGVVKSFYWTMIFYFVVLWLIMFALLAVTNFLIWISITRKKLKKTKPGFAGRFLALLFGWSAVWSLIFFEIFISIKPEVLLKWLAIVYLVYAHLTTLLYIAYFKRGNVRKALKNSFAAGFGKFQHFVMPYIYAGIIFFVLNKVLVPIQRYTVILGEFNGVNVSTFIIFIFFGAWLKIYIYSFAKKLV